ncbi:TPA: hypothetical protein ACNVAS_004227 [Citrobacter amalonaticus]|uniref:hypothetical protein n=1 Tax=Citrobacter farmeri TaxID=67824 RepID=UPI002DBFCEE4|nr:hypothetical protein [Citrobacter farmeri]MEC3934499.1 hypothetical protein [Citrobacter farmeri]
MNITASGRFFYQFHLVGIPTVALVDNVPNPASNTCGISSIDNEGNTMSDIMLFGRGYFGEVWYAECQSGLLELFERPDMYLLGGISDTEGFVSVSFTISAQTIRGNNYLIAFADKRPSNEEIEWAFFHSDRKPEPTTD